MERGTCWASSRERLADHDFLPSNNEVKRIGVEINWMAAILELTPPIESQSRQNSRQKSRNF